MSGIAQFFIEGGVWMLPIAGVSVITLAVAIERIYAILFVYNVKGAELYNKVANAVKNRNDNEAVQLCDQKGKAPLAQVLKSAVVHANEGEDSVSSAVEEATIETAPPLLKRTGSLGGLASIATLLGLLGTIMGLIEAFQVVAEAPADQKSVLLTKAIAVAMNTTAFGLLVAIPATMVYLLLAGTTKKIQDDIDIYSLKLENVIRNRRK